MVFFVCLVGVKCEGFVVLIQPTVNIGLRAAIDRWPRVEPFIWQASLVSVYLHMGNQTRSRLKFMTIAAARERQRPTCLYVCLFE